MMLYGICIMHSLASNELLCLQFVRLVYPSSLHAVSIKMRKLNRNKCSELNKVMASQCSFSKPIQIELLDKVAK